MIGDDEEIERRFLVTPGFTEKDLLRCLKLRHLSISQQYLNKVPGKSGRPRIRIEHDGETNTNSFLFTHKHRSADPRVRPQNEYSITEARYEELKVDADPTRESIFKRRICFYWNGQLFELDFFQSPQRTRGIVILEIELERPDQPVELPYFIPIAAEITGCLSNSDLAKRPQ